MKVVTVLDLKVVQSKSSSVNLWNMSEVTYLVWWLVSSIAEITPRHPVLPENNSDYQNSIKKN